MRLIDADAFLRSQIERCHGVPFIGTCSNDNYDLRYILDGTPTIDAVPVVHGVWERSIDNDCLMHKCSVCGARVVKGLYEYENPNRYCYHCGAKMDGERRSDD